MAKAPRLQRLPRGPLFRPLDVKSVKDEPLERTIEATAEECAAIAAGMDLPAVASVRASFQLVRRAGGRFDLSGTVAARVTQVCVVTLDPFEATIEQPVALSFAPAEPAVTMGDNKNSRGRHNPEPVAKPLPVAGSDEQEDPPDPLVDDIIDLGAVAVEFLSLALDPHPRKPGVHFSDMIVGDNDAPKPSAFAALARLKDQS